MSKDAPAAAPPSPHTESSALARQALFLAMVGLLPLHTVFLQAWISWKPWLVALAVLVVFQGIEGVRERRWPWHPKVSIGLAIFLVAAAASWSADYPDRFFRLLLALAVGGAVMLATERELRADGMPGKMMRVIYLSAAAMAVSAVVVSVIAIGVFGASAIDTVNDLPGIARVTKQAYLEEGFVAVTNWHQDPGYAAAWMNLWAVLGFMAILHGYGSRRLWVDSAVVGGLWFGVFMTLSRTGMIGFAAGLIAIGWWAWRRERLAAAVRLATGAVLAALLLIGAAWAIDSPGVGNDIGDSVSFRIRQGLSLGPGEGLGSGTGELIDYRGKVWPQYFDFFTDNPVRGIGLGTGWATPGLQEPHNLVLELMAEMGLVGLAGFIVLFGLVLTNASNRIGWIALAVSLAASITQTVLFEATWWFAAGLAISAPIAATTGPPWVKAPGDGRAGYIT